MNYSKNGLHCRIKTIRKYLAAKDEKGGNEFVRMNINEDKMLGHTTPTKPKAPAKPKNECAKLRPVSSPYEIWKSFDGLWTWLVLKKWQADDNKEFARWFCHVTSPFCPSGEMGDVYVSEIKAQATKFK